MFCPHGILLLEIEGTGRNKSTLFDKLKSKCSMWNIEKRMIKMMNLREIKAMLKSEFGIKYLYELSQVDLIQNNEDLVLGIVKVELQVSHKRYVLGTFNVWNAHQEISKRQVKKYMAYFDKIETWFADKQEVDVRVFNDEQYQHTRKVKRIEIVPCGTIEETQEEQQNEQKETKEVKEMELLKTIGNLINEMHIERTTNGLTPKWHELKALKEELNNKARSIIDDNYKDILKEETQEETQEETPYNYGKDSVDENCMNNQSSMLVAINNKDSQESICDFVPCGTTKQPTETVEPLLSLGDDIATQVFTSDHTSAPMFMANQLKKMIDTILYENGTDSFGTCKIAVYDHVDENKKPIYGIHVLENDYMIEFDKNTQAVTKIYENEFGFECGLSLATRDYIFNPLMKKIADEIETIYNGLER